MNITPVTIPSWVPFFMTGVVDGKNGRETGERTDYPPVPSALCISAFELCDGTKGGIFSNSSFLAFGKSIDCHSSDVFKLLVRSRRTQSP